ncbi:Lysosomal acid lipase/cholesteryl ester hydrolase [Halotydeus destructor]|nr:Lysosomal acid lipase/cholesteryl ester hydrolase [Halotydeus destructor]
MRSIILLAVNSVLIGVQLAGGEKCPKASARTSVQDPDELRDTLAIIESRGFVGEAHHVTTRDGYILELHRIVNPNLENTLERKKPVILQHGLIASSVDYVINDPHETLDWPTPTSANVSQGRNLGFSLSKLGYDVWLTNSRGNTYCRNHTYLNADTDRKFWEFTFDEHALIDLPTTIDYILETSRSDTVAYVGHSQGTLIMFALLATEARYNDLVKPFIALAPISTVGHIRSPVRYLARNPVLVDFFRHRGGQFFPSTRYIKYMAERVCESRYVAICSNVLFLFTGFDLPQLNLTRLSVYFTHTPAGTSAWNMVHYAQGVLTNKMAMFDFGAQENIRRYGHITPPEYRLEKVTNKYIGLISAQNDWLSDMTDVSSLRQKLRVPLVCDYTVPYSTWNHLDYILGRDAGILVNEKVAHMLDKYA